MELLLPFCSGLHRPTYPQGVKKGKIKSFVCVLMVVVI